MLQLPRQLLSFRAMAVADILFKTLSQPNGSDSQSSGLVAPVSGPNISRTRRLSRREGNGKRGNAGKSFNSGKDDLKLSLARDIDPSSYRNSTFHNICIEMLEKGFHESFNELLALVERQRKDHATAGPACVLLEPLIEHSITKMEYLKAQLTIAEDACRVRDLDTVYLAQRNLAQYFENTDDAKRTNDKWLSDHFYNRCLETGSKVTSDDHYKEGEAHCHIGLALENKGDMMKASLHMETFYKLSSMQQWLTESGESFLQIARDHLQRIYTSIAEEVHSTDLNMCISYLKKAHEKAREGGDTYQEGKVSYRLGNAFEDNGDPDTAIMYHRQFLECCRYHSDAAGMGRAYEAMAKSFESKGDNKNAVQFLEMYAAVAEKADIPGSLAEACNAIGVMYSNMGDYEKSLEYLGKCCEICSGLGDHAALHGARVQYGIASGQQFMGKFMHLVEESSSSSRLMQDLVAWKDARVNPYESATEREEEEEEEKEQEEEREEGEWEEEGETSVGATTSIGVETGVTDESVYSDVSTSKDSNRLGKP